MCTVKANLSGKRIAQATPVRMLAKEPVYSFTMLSKNLRMDATTSPPRDPNSKAITKRVLSRVVISKKWTNLNKYYKIKILKISDYLPSPWLSHLIDNKAKI